MTADVSPAGRGAESPENTVVDVAIVGGGLSGSLAAAVLTRAGYKIALIDKRAVYPDEFRVEKLGGGQVEILKRLGLLEPLARRASAFDTTLNIREGKLVDVSRGVNYGLPYAPMVAIARSQIADPAAFIVDQVQSIATTSRHLQRITLASGNEIVARLVILATGMAGALSHSLGIARRVLVSRHSLAFGFTIAPEQGTSFDFPALTCYGERTVDGIDYLSIFPMPEGIPAGADSVGRALFEKRLELVGLLHRAGVGILAGTDAPLRNSPPGFGLHAELALLVRAGMSPFAALRAATLLPARYFGIADSLGTIAAGMVADLVLVGANPLADIGNARQIEGVVANGRWLDVADLRELVARASR